MWVRVADHGFHVHFTPTPASRLDQVDRWFATRADNDIRRST
jgi:hypothetical protein